MSDLIFIPQRSEGVAEAMDELRRRLEPEPAEPDPPDDEWLARARTAEDRVRTASAALGEHVWAIRQLTDLPARSAPAGSPRNRVLSRLWRSSVGRVLDWYLAPVHERIRVFHEHVAAATRGLEEMDALRQDLIDARQDHLVHQLGGVADELRSEIGAIRGVQRDLLNEHRLLGRLDRLERLVQVLRLGGRDLPETSTPGDRSIVARTPDRFDYQAFEDRFRGSPAEIRERQAPLIEAFRDAPGPVLDLGCGRGEFLGLLAEAGIDGYGIDESPQLVDHCRAAGRSAFRDGAIVHLLGLADQSLGGILASHLVEHLDRADLWSLIRLAGAKLRPGGGFVVESPNPRTLAVGATTFWLDPTHERPVHPDTAQFLAELAGFEIVDLRFTEPFPAPDRLPGLPDAAAPVERALDDLIARLNDLLFGPRDYALIARVPRPRAES